MRSFLVGTAIGAVLVALLAPAVAHSLVTPERLFPPHDKTANGEQACYFCHSLAVRTETTYTLSTACLDCHNQSGQAFGAPWVPATDEAVPGTTGTSHSWSKPGASPAHGAQIVGGFADDYVWSAGNLQCVVCHNAHDAPAGLKPGSMHTSIPVGVGQAATSGSGSATLTLTAAPGSNAEGFRLQIQSVDVARGEGYFILSHDYGWNAESWLNWNGTAWIPGTSGGQGKKYVNNTDVDLDIAGIKVKWTAGAAVGDLWDFYVGYPFLRVTNVNDDICFSCHKERVMNHVRARGDDRYYRPNGVRKFSHPVNVGLNANGLNSDRGTVLDADGTATTDLEGKLGTSASDAEDGQRNATNDLVLDGGLVRCTTCHRVHNADSNSLSRDAR